MFNKFLEWITFRDYDRAKHEATKEVVRRYTRGNIALKNGLFIDEAALDRLSVAGDRAASHLAKMMGS